MIYCRLTQKILLHNHAWKWEVIAHKIQINLKVFFFFKYYIHVITIFTIICHNRTSHFSIMFLYWSPFSTIFWQILFFYHNFFLGGRGDKIHVFLLIFWWNACFYHYSLVKSIFVCDQSKKISTVLCILLTKFTISYWILNEINNFI